MKIKHTLVALVVGVYSCFPAHAGGIPTIDLTNFIQNTITALETIDQTINQVKQVKNQVDSLKNLDEQLKQQLEQYKNMSGTYGVSQLLNTSVDKEFRRFVPQSWNDAASLVDAVGLAGHQLEAQKAAQDALEEGRRYQAQDVFKDVNSEPAKQYEKKTKKLASAAGVGQAYFNRTEERLEYIENLTAEIDNATDMKQAVDLQNRIAAENAVLLNEVIRLNSAGYISKAEEEMTEVNRRAVDVRMGETTIPELTL